MYDVMIIGGGPAGITAGIYCARANLKTIVFEKESIGGQIASSPLIQNFPGFISINGAEFANNLYEQATNLGVDIEIEEVLSIKPGKIKTVVTDCGEYQTKTVIIATGAKHRLLHLPNEENLIGNGISFCTACDGAFYKGKDVVVIGNGDYAISEADDLKGVASSVRILTNGLEKPENANDYEIVDKKIKEITGEGKVSEIIFDDDSKLEVAGVFIALGRAGGADFAKKLGVLTEGDTITVDDNMKTSVDGIYSCGDAVGGLLQVSKSVSDGAKAGIDAASYIRNLK